MYWITMCISTWGALCQVRLRMVHCPGSPASQRYSSPLPQSLAKTPPSFPFSLSKSILCLHSTVNNCHGASVPWFWHRRRHLSQHQHWNGPQETHTPIPRCTGLLHLHDQAMQCCQRPAGSPAKSDVERDVVETIRKWWRNKWLFRDHCHELCGKSPGAWSLCGKYQIGVAGCRCEVECQAESESCLERRRS